MIAVFYHDDNYKPNPRYVTLSNQYYNILAVFGSLCWLSFMVEHVLNIVNLIGVVTGISQVGLAIGIIAIGNCFPGKPE